MSQNHEEDALSGMKLDALGRVEPVTGQNSISTDLVDQDDSARSDSIQPINIANACSPEVDMQCISVHNAAAHNLNNFSTGLQGHDSPNHSYPHVSSAGPGFQGIITHSATPQNGTVQHTNLVVTDVQNLTAQAANIQSHHSQHETSSDPGFQATNFQGNDSEGNGNENGESARHDNFGHILQESPAPYIYSPSPQGVNASTRNSPQNVSYLQGTSARRIMNRRGSQRNQGPPDGRANASRLPTSLIIHPPSSSTPPVTSQFSTHLTSSEQANGLQGILVRNGHTQLTNPLENGLRSAIGQVASDEDDKELNAAPQHSISEGVHGPDTQTQADRAQSVRDHATRVQVARVQAARFQATRVNAARVQAARIQAAQLPAIIPRSQATQSQNRVAHTQAVCNQAAQAQNSRITSFINGPCADNSDPTNVRLQLQVSLAKQYHANRDLVRRAMQRYGIEAIQHVQRPAAQGFRSQVQQAAVNGSPPPDLRGQNGRVISTNTNVFDRAFQAIEEQEIQLEAAQFVRAENPLPTESNHLRIAGEREALQAYLIHQQLLAGIDPDQVDPMSGNGSRQTQSGPEGIRMRYRPLSSLSIDRFGNFHVPYIPPARYWGVLDAFDVHPGNMNIDQSTHASTANRISTAGNTGFTNGSPQEQRLVTDIWVNNVNGQADPLHPPYPPPDAEENWEDEDHQINEAERSD